MQRYVLLLKVNKKSCDIFNKLLTAIRKQVCLETYEFVYTSVC